MSAIDDALRNWWERARPDTERELRRSYNLGHFGDKVYGFLLRCTREAFIAGWKARERHAEAEGTQPRLFDQEDDHG